MFTLRELFKDLTLDGTEVLPVASCATVGNVNLRYFATPFPAQRNRFSQLRCLVQVAAGPIRQGRGNRGRQSSRTHGGKTDERQKQLQAAGMKTKPRAHGGHPHCQQRGRQLARHLFNCNQGQTRPRTYKFCGTEKSLTPSTVTVTAPSLSTQAR
eukprot:132575-Rhodomonas_salina.1